jgi:hypothetical protein
MHVYVYMGVVRRNKDGVDALEHAVQGVHTSNDHSLVRSARERGLIGTTSPAKADARDETSSEREVIVKVRRSSSRSRRSR